MRNAGTTNIENPVLMPSGGMIRLRQDTGRLDSRTRHARIASVPMSAAPKDAIEIPLVLATPDRHAGDRQAIPCAHADLGRLVGVAAGALGRNAELLVLSLARFGDLLSNLRKQRGDAAHRRNVLVTSIRHLSDVHPDFRLDDTTAGRSSRRRGHHDDVHCRRSLLSAFEYLVDVAVEHTVVAGGRTQRDDDAEEIALVARETLKCFTQ